MSTLRKRSLILCTVATVSCSACFAMSGGEKDNLYAGVDPRVACGPNFSSQLANSSNVRHHNVLSNSTIPPLGNQPVPAPGVNPVPDNRINRDENHIRLEQLLPAPGANAAPPNVQGVLPYILLPGGGTVENANYQNK